MPTHSSTTDSNGHSDSDVRDLTDLVNLTTSTSICGFYVQTFMQPPTLRIGIDMNELLVDLKGYKLQAKANFLRDMLTNIVLAAVALGGLFLLMLASTSSSPVHFIVGCVTLLGSVLVAIYLYRKQSKMPCKGCGEIMENGKADFAPEDFEVTGGLVDHVRFTAYGRTYTGTQEVDSEDWVRLVQHVAVCKKCKRYTQLLPCQEEAINENDTWVINEHLNCDPIPMEVRTGQTLTQFEIAEARRAAQEERMTAPVG